MSRMEPFKITEELKDKIISVAYNDASLRDRIMIRILAKRHSEVKKIHGEFKSTADSVHSIPERKCPDELLYTIKNASGIRNNKKRSFLLELYTIIFSRPTMSAAVSALVVLVLLSALIIERPKVEETYSRSEIELANRQVKESLAIVGRIFKKTETAIKKEVLTNLVGKPLKQGMSIVNNLFIEGETK